MSMTATEIDSLDWDKERGLIPGIVQDAQTEAVLMLGYLSRESLRASFERGRVVFFSRSRQTLWEKGETSGNTLHLLTVDADCDSDCLLLRVRATGPVCHRDTATCFGDGSLPDCDGIGFLAKLEGVIESRIAERREGSYTARLYEQGLRRMAQKVGEEGVEIALAATAEDDEALLNESADMLYHLALLLKARGLSLAKVAAELAARHKTKMAAT
jgi:phosphoribosyl-AMP cyclohydrolase / phosphoribosyl-ATP pyrophosphohydrolase